MNSRHTYEQKALVSTPEWKEKRLEFADFFQPKTS